MIGSESRPGFVFEMYIWKPPPLPSELVEGRDPKRRKQAFRVISDEKLSARFVWGL